MRFSLAKASALIALAAPAGVQAISLDRACQTFADRLSAAQVAGDQQKAKTIYAGGEQADCQQMQRCNLLERDGAHAPITAPHVSDPGLLVSQPLRSVEQAWSLGGEWGGLRCEECSARARCENSQAAKTSPGP